MASDLVRHGVNRVDKQSASTLAALAKYSIVFFTVLIVLDQLRVAQDLIRILFTGIVIMISLAGGLAFGLGGKDLAKDLLEKMRQRV
jgi:small-conductance mechanosensitive channel